jgi:hypothetical protein
MLCVKERWVNDYIRITLLTHWYLLISILHSHFILYHGFSLILRSWAWNLYSVALYSDFPSVLSSLYFVPFMGIVMEHA